MALKFYRGESDSVGVMINAAPVTTVLNPKDAFTADGKIVTVADVARVPRVSKSTVYKLARIGSEFNDPKGKGWFFGRAISIIGEINSVLDFEQGGEIARSLHRLYKYMLSELVMANAPNDVRRFDGPYRCLTTLREGWREIAARQTPLAGV